MARSKHSRDHMASSDETFQFRGSVPAQLAAQFTAQGPHRKRIQVVRGPPCSGKTRTAKECARVVQRILEERNGKHVHTFLYDLKSYDMLDKLKQGIVKDLKEHVPDAYDDNETGDIPAFTQIGSHMIYLFVFDDIDKMSDSQLRPTLTHIEDFVQKRDNVYMFLTGRAKINFVRIPRIILEHNMEPLKPEDAKELLIEASGNSEGLQECADQILNLLCRSPLALMIAGYEMNSAHSDLPYTPEEMVELLEDSTFLTMNLDNVPEDDRLSERIEVIAANHYSVLEKVFFAVEDPQSFNASELYESMSEVSSAQIKRSILRVLLDGSLCSMHKREGQQQEVQLSPLLKSIFHEAFCQISSKDGFLKPFNSELCKAVRDETVLKTSRAHDIKLAERQLITKQKQGLCSPQGKKALRESILMQSVKLLKDINPSEVAKFEKFGTHLIRTMESAERDSSQNGENETNNRTASTPTRTPEPEACISPVAPSSCPFSDQQGTRQQNPGTGQKVKKLVLTVEDPIPRTGECPENGEKNNRVDNSGNFSEFHSLQSNEQNVTVTGTQFDINKHLDNLNLDGRPMPLQSTDQNPSTECLQVEPDPNSTRSYSELSTLPDQWALNGTAASQSSSQSREAVEAEYDWAGTEGDAGNAAGNAGQPTTPLPLQETSEGRQPVQETLAGSATPASVEANRPNIVRQPCQQNRNRSQHDYQRDQPFPGRGRGLRVHNNYCGGGNRGHHNHAYQGDNRPLPRQFIPRQQEFASNSGHANRYRYSPPQGYPSQGAYPASHWSTDSSMHPLSPSGYDARQDGPSQFPYGQSPHVPSPHHTGYRYRGGQSSQPVWHSRNQGEYHGRLQHQVPRGNHQNRRYPPR